MLHTFENGYCTTCGEDLDYYCERQRERAIIGPLLPLDDMQLTLPLTINAWATL